MPRTPKPEFRPAKFFHSESQKTGLFQNATHDRPPLPLRSAHAIAPLRKTGFVISAELIGTTRARRHFSLPSPFLKYSDRTEKFPQMQPSLEDLEYQRRAIAN
jgi:hypothetical protein